MRDIIVLVPSLVYKPNVNDCSIYATLVQLPIAFEKSHQRVYSSESQGQLSVDAEMEAYSE